MRKAEHMSESQKDTARWVGVVISAMVATGVFTGMHYSAKGDIITNTGEIRRVKDDIAEIKTAMRDLSMQFARQEKMMAVVMDKLGKTN